jgi:hypothetical protein
MENQHFDSKPQFRKRLAMLLAYPSAALIALMVYADHYARAVGDRFRDAVAQRPSLARKRRV